MRNKNPKIRWSKNLKLVLTTVKLIIDHHESINEKNIVTKNGGLFKNKF